MAKRPTGRPTTKRAAQIADDVVEATIHEFAMRGGNFSMDEVAKRAKVSKQAIYRRWSSKLDLLVYAVDESLLKFVAEADQDQPSHDLDALKAIAWKFFNTDAATYRISIFLQVEAFNVEELRVATLKWRQQMSSTIKARLDTLAGEGQLADVDNSICADLLMDILNGGSSKLVAMGKLTIEERREQFGPLWQAYLRIIMP